MTASDGNGKHRNKIDFGGATLQAERDLNGREGCSRCEICGKEITWGKKISKCIGKDLDSWCEEKLSGKQITEDTILSWKEVRTRVSEWMLPSSLGGCKGDGRRIVLSD